MTGLRPPEELPSNNLFKKISILPWEDFFYGVPLRSCPSFLGTSLAQGRSVRSSASLRCAHPLPYLTRVVLLMNFMIRKCLLDLMDQHEQMLALAEYPKVTGRSLSNSF